MRKTVWIPVAAMADRPERTLLELIIERGAWPAESTSGLANLTVHGLGHAAKIAETALVHAKLLPHFLWVNTKTVPYLYTSNPIPALSNTSGAALAIALGLLMYEGYLPNHRLIACGGLFCSAKTERVTLLAVDKMEQKLELALSLGRQECPLAFVVPAYLRDGYALQDCFAPQIQALAQLNIHVLPSTTLQDALAACKQLENP